MIRVCAWHPKYFQIVKFMGITEPLEDTRVTHGICEECKFALHIETQVKEMRLKFDREFDAFNKIKLG